MESKDIRNLYEAYSSIYEKNNADYEPEGDYIEEDIRNRDINARGGFDPRFDRKPKPTPTATAPKPIRNRDINARGGFDPRFDRKPKPTPTATAPKPTGPVAQKPKPTGPVAQKPKPAGGLLGTLDKTARDTAGRVGEVIGRERAKSVTGANLPILGNVIRSEGGRRGRNQGQQMYDKAKETVGGLLKQDYEFDNFDVILEYLVAEGYAETEEAALAIMSNMSEEWRQDIVEFVPAPAGSDIDRHSRGISKYDKRSERQIRMDNFASKRTKMLNQPKTP